MASKITKSPTFSSPPVSRVRSRLTVPSSVDDVAKKIFAASPSNGRGASPSSAFRSPSAGNTGALTRSRLRASPSNGGGSSSTSEGLNSHSLFSLGGFSPNTKGEKRKSEGTEGEGGNFSTPNDSSRRTKSRFSDVKDKYLNAKQQNRTYEKSAFGKKAEEIKDAISVGKTLKLEMCGKPITVKIEEYLGRGNFSDAYRCTYDDDDFVISLFYDSAHNAGGKTTDHYLFNKMKRYEAIAANPVLNQVYTPHLNFDDFMEGNSIDADTVKEHFNDGFILTKYIPGRVNQIRNEDIDQLIPIIKAHVEADIIMDLNIGNLRRDQNGRIYLIDVYEFDSDGQDDDDVHFANSIETIADKGSAHHRRLIGAHEEAKKVRPKREKGFV